MKQSFYLGVTGSFVLLYLRHLFSSIGNETLNQTFLNKRKRDQQ